MATVVAAVVTGAFVMVVPVRSSEAALEAAEPTFVAAGGEHSCGLTTADTIECWGLASFGATTAPPGTSFAAVVAEGNYSCGLTSNGSPVCWGNGPAVTELANLAPGTSFTQLQGGAFHACGMTATGGVQCWGGNGFNQATVPVDLAEATAVTAGGSHSCALGTTGAVRCWGRLSEGQTMAPAEDFVQISAGTFHTCGVTTGGQVLCWGSDNFGQAPAVTTGPFVQVSAGSTHTCALDAEGAATCWGNSSLGATAAPAEERFDEISAGSDHNCGLTQEGSRIVCWGRNAGGQATPPDSAFGPAPPDTTAPVVTGAVSEPPNDQGWHRAPVTVSWTVDDPTATQPPDSVIDVEGAASTVVSSPSCDPAGNCATGTVTVQLDLTPPTLELVSPSDGSTLPVADYVPPTCSAADALSGLAAPCSVTVGGPTPVPGGYTETVTATASDIAGNSATTAPVTYTVITDDTGPTIEATAMPSANGAGWWNAAVTFTFECTDPAGVASCPADRTISDEGADQSFVVSAVDALGLASQLTVAAVNIDLTPPTVAVGGPDSAGPLDTVVITCAAADALSGLAATDCADLEILPGGLSVGDNVFTFAATDMAGNTTSASKTVTLVNSPNTAPTVRADMGVDGLNEVGFKSRRVELTGSFDDADGVGPYAATIQWQAGGPEVPLPVSAGGRFTATTTYSGSAGALRTATVTVCDAGGACGSDEVIIRIMVRANVVPLRRCVEDQSLPAAPSFVAHWGFNNPASFAIAVPSKPKVENTFTKAPHVRGQPQVFLPGRFEDVFATTFTSGRQTWQLNGRSVTAAPSSPRC